MWLLYVYPEWLVQNSKDRFKDLGNHYIFPLSGHSTKCAWNIHTHTYTHTHIHTHTHTHTYTYIHTRTHAHTIVYVETRRAILHDELQDSGIDLGLDQTEGWAQLVEEARAGGLVESIHIPKDIKRLSRAYLRMFSDPPTHPELRAEGTNGITEYTERLGMLFQSSLATLVTVTTENELQVDMWCDLIAYYYNCHS